MTKITLKFRLEYWAVRLIAMLLRRLPRATALKLGGRLGLLAGMLLPRRRKLAEENLRRAFPEWSRRQVQTMAWANFQHVGLCGAEMLRQDMFRSGSGDLEQYFEMVDQHYLQEALALGRGAILLTGHFGFWEAGFFALPETGIKFDAVTKPLKNPLTDEYFTNIREAFGARTLDSRKGARRILKALQEGSSVAILLDQHISPPGSVPTEFFGRMAYTTTAITNMAMKYQIPVVPTFCHRTPENRYKIWSEPMLLLEGKGDAAIARNTQLLTEVIEKVVRRDPAQWFWVHKRWRVSENQSFSHAKDVRKRDRRE